MCGGSEKCADIEHIGWGMCEILRTASQSVMVVRTHIRSAKKQ